MRLELTAEEQEVLVALLESASRDRQRQIHHSHSRDYRRRLERETELIDALRARLVNTVGAN